MSEHIKKTDVIEDGIFKSLIEDLERSEKALKDFDEQLIATAKRLKTEVPKSTEASIFSMEKLAAIEKKLDADVEKKKQNQKQLSTLQKEKLKLDQQVERAVAQKILVRSKENKAIQELRLERNKENKAIRDGIKAKERESNAYLKLSDATQKYKNESKRLGAELLQLRESGKKNTKEYRELAKTYNTVTKNAQRGDAQLKKLDKTVGDNQRNVGNYANATRKLSSALGALGIAFGLSTVVRSATSIISNFNQAQVDLQAISGKSAEELTGLTKQAKDLGATTQFSATQITELQIELAKLGFTTQEITDSTGGIANFAAATGVEIPRAAALAGSALRAFNLDATEIDRVVSTLGVATTKTALDFAKLENGLSTVAPVAAAFGFSIEDTTALLGQLANAGFDASTSATATRNILLNLADANGALAKELGRPIKSADDLADGLQELQARGVDLAKALELTDKRSVAAFSTFISGSGSLVELRDSITDVNDELDEMADKRLDSVQGAMLLLQSAWEGFILDLNESVGASEAFQTAIKFIADNLTTILGTLARVGVYWLLYTHRVRIASAATFLFRGGLRDVIRSIPRMISGLRGATLSINALGTAMKKIPFVAIVAGITEVVSWLWRQSEATDAVNDSEREKNDQIERGLNLENARIGNLKNISQQIANINNLNQTGLKNLKNLIDAEIQSLEVAEARRSSEEKSVKNLEEELQLAAPIIQAKEKIAALEKELETASGGRARTLRKQIATEKDVLNQMIRTQREQSKLNVYEETGIKLTEEQAARLEELRSQLALVESKIIDTTKDREKEAEATRAQNKALEDQLKAYQSLIDLEDELWFRNLGNEDQEVVKRMQQLEDELAKVEADTMMRAEEREALRKALIEDSEKDIQAIRDKFAKERKDKEIKDEEERIAREKEAITKHIEALEEQADLAFQIRQNEIYKQKLNEEEHQKAMLESEKAYLEELIKIRKENGLETIELENQLAELNRKNADLTISSITNQVNETSRVIKSMLEESIDRAIESENRLMNNSQKMIDSLRQAAIEGNLQAKESILAEEKAIEESQKRIEKHQRNKQRMEFISTGINTFNSSVQSGKSGLEALGETAVTMSGLAGMLAGLLPSFDVGADRLTGDGRGVDGKGGFLAINHPNERILTADHNKRIGFDMRNDDIVDVVDFYKKGLLVPRDEVAVVSQQVDNTALLERIDKGFSKINNWNISVDELFGNISVLIEKSKNGDIHRSKRNFKA